MVVSADDALVLRCGVGSIECIVGATADGAICGRNELLQQLGRDWIVAAGCDLNVRRWKADVPRGSGRAAPNGKWERIGGKSDGTVGTIVGHVVVTAEIPAQLRRVEYWRQLRYPHPIPESLVGKKEEETILDDRATQCTAIEVLVKIRPAGGKVISVGQESVAIKLKSASMEACCFPTSGPG